MTDGAERAPEVEVLIRASAAFGEQVAAVGDHEWDLPTPCAEWDVRSLVAHVVVGDSQVARTLAGERIERVEEVDASILGPSPLATWRGTAIAAIEAFSVPGILDEVHPHPVGDLPGRHILGFRVTDGLVHAWDLARARSVDIELADDIAEYCLEFWLPMARGLERSGYFSAAVDPGPAAAAPARLLALLGRQT